MRSGLIEPLDVNEEL
jgi:hypothetical protein